MQGGFAPEPGERLGVGRAALFLRARAGQCISCVKGTIWTLPAGLNTPCFRLNRQTT